MPEIIHHIELEFLDWVGDLVFMLTFLAYLKTVSPVPKELGQGSQIDQLEVAN